MTRIPVYQGPHGPSFVIGAPAEKLGDIVSHRPIRLVWDVESHQHFLHVDLGAAGELPMLVLPAVRCAKEGSFGLRWSS